MSTTRARASGAFAMALSAAIAGAVFGGCASYPAGRAWSSPGPDRGDWLRVEVIPARPGEGGVPSGAPDGVPATGAERFRVSGGALEGAVLVGEAERDGEGWRLEATGLEWFNNWPEGWTEGEFSVEGALSLRPRDGSWALECEEAPRIGAPTKASIRLYGDYLEAEAARSALARRWDRIAASVEVLEHRFPGAWFERSDTKYGFLRLTRARGFDEEVRGFLFPELYGYPAGERPPKASAGPRAESIRWDSEYTAGNFPEPLRELRDSGTLLRDFEESPGLWRLAFVWKRLWEERARAAEFRPAKRR